MSAQTLRKAAALMRERAKDVFIFHSSPWQVLPGPAGWAVIRSRGVITEDPDGFIEVPTGHDTYVLQMDTTSTAEHIASWHPIVALLVADLLDQSAFWMEGGGEPDDLALAVARAYLGSDQ